MSFMRSGLTERRRGVTGAWFAAAAAMVRGALCGGLLLLLLGGCVVVVRDDAPPASLPLVRQIRQEALQESPPSGIYVAPLRFAEPLEDFGIDLRRAQVGPMPPGDADMELLLRLFARTLEEVPEGERAGAGLAAEEMREAAAAMQGRGLPGSPPHREAFTRGVSVGVETLLALAYGPYGGAADVVERAAELEPMFEATLQARPMSYEAGLEVMRRVLLVLKAMQESVSAPRP
ncbi:hypothetical protein [Polyangium spumosum]|uniref:Uncharacterized protein n=1 Tax=Polyangium spumosum TaxID=889282 RepID=A0A6N7PV44_9BACT|nr:hypothetical protein [Polyangium spumosum]MRG95779.1 hypothetical protein [Polyangium spumosum]